MTLLYQPISRTFGQRDGCLTPNNHDEKNKTVLAPKATPSRYHATGSATSSHEILSPPLSPYQKDVSAHDAGDELPANPRKTYLDSEHPFKVENFRSYSLTVNPWTRLGSHYKDKQLDFLNKYTFEAPRTLPYLHITRLADRRAERKRHAHQASSDSDLESVERVRTRRVVKENHAPLSEIEEPPASAKSVLPPQKKRKVRKEAPYAGSPLAAQQAALIDESIPDYSPDAYATLPKGNNRALKIEWKGQPMDLRSDPNLSKLHPAEVVLALTLRLRCNVYLDSKRRLFYEKVTRVRNDMPFRRTDAQKACRIDVNKASRLFAAFEKVGWLDDKHFKKYT